MDKVTIGESTLKDFGDVINEAADILNKGKVAFDNTIPDKTLQVLPYTGQAGAIIPSKIGDLTQLTTTAKDSLVNAINEVDAESVKITGDQTIGGNKTFSNQVNFINPAITVAPTNNNHIVPKHYVDGKSFDYKQNSKPAINTNPPMLNATWFDTKENEIYVCIDNTTNNNKWVGNKSGYIGGSYVTANPGEAGFGCGVAPSEIVSKYNMTPMEGTYNPNSKNYGNYTDKTGSVMVWIPKVYVKYTYDTADPYFGLKIEVSNTAKADYFLPRCFINNGKEIDGFFIDKYACSPENKIGVSKRFGQPLCTHNNGISVNQNLELPADVVSALSLSNGTILNRADALPLAAKTRGVHYSLPTAFMFHHLADLVDAHYFASRDATNNFNDGDYSLCAWADIKPYSPKGPNNSLVDYFDTSVVFQLSTNNNGSTYLTPRCGSCSDSVFPKNTHNGQWCGVADMNGTIWQGALGLISNDSANICIMKESTNATDIVTSNLYDYSLYDEITSLSYYKTSVLGQNYYPTTGQIWTNELDRTTDKYKLQSVGFPSSLIAGQNNNFRYGCDSVWLYHSRNQLFPYYLNCCVDQLRAGTRSLAFDSVLSYSLINRGFRACIIPD